MNLKIHDENKIYSLNLEQMTQLCGRNVRKKNYMIESLKKYFSASKYMEYEKKYIDNVQIENETVGRKYFQVFHCSDRREMIDMIKLSKASMMSQYMMAILKDYNYQIELERIEEILENIFLKINQEVMKQFQSIELDYAPEKLWSMVQQSEIKGKDGKHLEELSNVELVQDFLILFQTMQNQNSTKQMVIFENLDHLVSVEEYKAIYKQCEEISVQSDSWFLFTSSLNDYVVVNKENIEGINVVNEEEYVLPDLEHLIEFINMHYPYYKIWTNEEMIEILERIIHDIGKSGIKEIEEQVIVILLNRTMCLKEYMKKEPKKEEISYLMDKNPVFDSF